MDREELMKTMRGRGKREDLVKRVNEMLGKTKSRVRIRGKMGKEFRGRERVETEMSVESLVV